MIKKIITLSIITGLIFLASLYVSIGSADEIDSASMTEEEAEEKEEGSSASVTFFAMDTVMSVKANGPGADAAVKAVEMRIMELEKDLAVRDPESLVYGLNHNEGAFISEDIKYLFERSEDIREMTDGSFNIFIYPLMEAWGFSDGDYRIPNAETLAVLCENAGNAGTLQMSDNGMVTLCGESMVDFGGIAKGYAAEAALEIFEKAGIKSALINLGGNVCAIGPKSDGSLWKVAVRSPFSEYDYLGVLTISDISVITSGGYERFFEEDGRIYHHIIDPVTGYPADSGLLSVTIVSVDPVLADALSTAVYVMGMEKAVDLWKSSADDFEMILYDENLGLFITEGLEDAFSSEVQYEVIKR